MWDVLAVMWGTPGVMWECPRRDLGCPGCPPWGLKAWCGYLLLLGLQQEIPGPWQLLLAVLARSCLFLLLLFLHHALSCCPGSGVLGWLPHFQERPIAARALCGGERRAQHPEIGLGVLGTPTLHTRPYLQPWRPGWRKAEISGGSTQNSPQSPQAPLHPPQRCHARASSPCSPRCHRLCLAGSGGRAGDGGVTPVSPSS